MADFPSYGKLISVKETVVEPILRSELDRGKAKQKRKYSLDQWQVEVSYVFTASEYDSFITWWRSTINHGADFFNYTLPTRNTPTVVSARIKSGVIHADPVNVLLQAWSVSFTLEFYQ